MSTKRKSITIEVTAEDIAHGTKSNCMDCPIARALRRAFPEWNVETYNYQAQLVKYAKEIGGPHQVKNICLTDKAIRFIERFDSGDLVEPTTLRFTNVHDREFS